MFHRLALILCIFPLVFASPVIGQGVAKPNPGIKGLTVPDEPAEPRPVAKDFVDRKYRLSFHVPAGWDFERKDGVLSNFGADVRTTRRLSSPPDP